MKKKKMLPLIFSITAIIGVIITASVIKGKLPGNDGGKGYAVTVSSPDTVSENTEMRGVWISYMELSMENETSKSKDSFIKKFDSIAKNCSEKGFNTLIVQVRPFCDAMYNSKLFPWSHILTGTQGKNPKYDPLSLMCGICKKYNLKIHAWVNPYRISTNETPQKLAKNNPYEKDKSIGKEIDEGIFLDPSNKKAQNLICNGVAEIAKNYDIDGIQFDDYFYPTQGESFDAKQYNSYIKKCGKNNSMTQENWRKANVNMLICNVYRTIKSIDSNIQFGISPQGNLSNNDGLYADVKSWCTCRGFADYICPQLYFSTENPALSFEDSLKSWTSLDFDEGVNLYVGLAGYKAGSDEYDDGTWSKSNTILSDEYNIMKKYSKVKGFMLYSYASLENNTSKKEVNNLMSKLE